jgi:hypothetical protein
MHPLFRSILGVFIQGGWHKHVGSLSSLGFLTNTLPFPSFLLPQWLVLSQEPLLVGLGPVLVPGSVVTTGGTLPDRASLFLGPGAWIFF